MDLDLFNESIYFIEYILLLYHQDLLPSLSLLKRILPPRCARQSGIKASLLPAGASGASPSGGPTGVFLFLYPTFIFDITYIDNQKGHFSAYCVLYTPFPVITSSFAYT